MSYDDKLITNPGAWSITLTNGNTVANAAGILLVTAGARTGDAVLDDDGRILVIKDLTETTVTFAWPYKASTRTIDLVIEKRSINRALNTATSAAAVEALSTLQLNAALAANYPVLGIFNALPSTPADGDRILIGAAPTGAIPPGAAKNLAVYSSATGLWTYTPPIDGMSVVLAGTSSRLQYNGAAGLWGSDGLQSPGVTIAGRVPRFTNTAGGIGLSQMSEDGSGNVSIAGSVSVTGAAKRFLADFTNATIVNRSMFQTSVVDGFSTLALIPNGTSAVAQFNAVNNSSPTNASVAQLVATATEISVRSGVYGTGSYLPLAVYTGGSERARFDTTGKFLIGLTSSASNAMLSVAGAAQFGAPAGPGLRYQAIAGRWWMSGINHNNDTLNDVVISGSSVAPDFIVNTAGNVAISNDLGMNGNFGVGGHISSTGTAKRFFADFSNATAANRFSLQTSAVNGNTLIPILPNGTATVGGLQTYGLSDPTNSHYLGLYVSGVNTFIDSGKNGTGTYGSLLTYTGGVPRTTILSTGEVGIGSAPVAGAGVLQVFRQGIGGGNPVNTGGTDPNQYAVIGSGNVSVRFGGYVSGQCWIQPSFVGSYGTNFGLTLCPNGGDVAFGGPAAAGQVVVQANTGGTLALARTDGNAWVVENTGNGASLDFGYRNAGAGKGVWAAGPFISVSIGGVVRLGGATTGVSQQAGFFYPNSDNAINLGSPAARWATVYAGTGTINTSDVREKLLGTSAIANDHDAYLLAAADTPQGWFQWLEAIERKGEAGARWHFGPTAQGFRDACLARGVDPTRIAAYCEDPLFGKVTRTRAARRQVVETVTVERTEIEIIDGVPTQKLIQVEEKRPVTDMVAVVDSAGQPVMTERRSPGDGGEDIVTLVPLLHPVPRMEDYDEEYTEEVPRLDDSGEPYKRLGLRLDQFDRLRAEAVRRIADGSLIYTPPSA